MMVVVMVVVVMAAVTALVSQLKVLKLLGLDRPSSAALHGACVLVQKGAVVVNVRVDGQAV
ncbi:hypothetical protein IWW55_003909, partial [Coemansia sp. RSA 2706]